MLQLKQKGEDLVVFIHAALSNDNVQRPVNLKEITECGSHNIFVLEILRMFQIQVFQGHTDNICILIMQCKGQAKKILSFPLHAFFTPLLKVFHY